jgi:hypothetical protein
VGVLELLETLSSQRRKLTLLRFVVWEWWHYTATRGVLYSLTINLQVTVN